MLKSFFAGVLIFLATTFGLHHAPVATTSTPAEPVTEVLTVVNHVSTEPITLVANTRFETIDHLMFRAPQAITIPGKRGTTDGTVEVTVVADQAGSQYDIGAAHLTLPGLAGNPTLYQGIYAYTSGASPQASQVAAAVAGMPNTSDMSNAGSTGGISNTSVNSGSLSDTPTFAPATPPDPLQSPPQSVLTASVASANYVTQDELTAQIQQATNALRSYIYENGSTPNTLRASGGFTNNIALTNDIDQLSGTTLNNVTVNGVSGLTAADIPTNITAASYLPLAGGTLTGDFTVTGNFNVNGAQTLSGAITIPYLSATSTIFDSTFIRLTATNATTTNATSTSVFTSTFGLGSGNYFTSLLGAGLANISNALSLDLAHANIWTGLQQFFGNASTTQLSAITAYFGGTATSTFGADGSLTLASPLSIGSGGTGTTSATGAMSNLQYLFPGSATSVARSLLSKLSDSVSVKDFGAKGDGVTDDTSAIQNAMAYASTTMNGAVTVYFPAGTYEVSAPIVANSSVQMDPGATIQATAPMAAVVEIGPDSPSRGKYGHIENVSFIGGTIDANNQANDGLFLRHYEHVSVQNVIVNNFLVNGFHFNDPTLGGFNTEVIASDLHTIRTSGNIPAGSVSLLMDTNGTDNQLSDSVFTQSDIGVDVKTAGEFFSNIHVYSYPPANGYMTIGFKDEGYQNYWKGCEADGPTVYGMYVSGFDPSIIGCRFDTVAGYSADDTTYAIYFPSSTTPSPTASIIGNYFTGVSGGRFLTDIAASSNANIQAYGNIDAYVASPANIPTSIFTLAASATIGTSTIASGQGFTIGGSQFVLQQGSGNVGVGTNAPTHQLGLSGTVNGSSATGGLLNLTSTLNSTAAANYLVNFAPTLASTSSASPFIIGMRISPTISTTKVPSIVNFYNVNSAPNIDASYAGTITNLLDFFASNPTGSAGAGKITNFIGYGAGGNTNGDGLTSGSVQNRDFYTFGATASSSVGGVVSNYDYWATVPTGSPNGGTTGNYGFYITGNGGPSANGGTVANYAIYNNSTANNYLAGNVGIGTATPYSKLSVWGANATAGVRTFELTNSASTTLAFVDNAGTAYFKGNVGVGTTTPQGLLTVANAANGFSGTPQMWLDTTSTNTALVLDNASAGGHQWYIMSSGSGAAVPSSFRIYDNTVSAERMVINSSGNVAIGTTTPYSRLTVWGADTSGNTAALTISNSASTTELQVFDNGNATLAGTLTQNSDQRLKTNVQSLNNSNTLALIDQLNPVTFNWIDPSEGSTSQVGLIAQQVQTIFPQLVSTTSATALTPGGTLGLNYIGLIFPIVSAIQALSTEIASIESTMAGLAQSITTQVLTAATGHFSNELCVGSTCVTPAQFQTMVTAAGQTGEAPSTSGQGSNGVSGTSATSTPDTPPVITINGNNPAIIYVGDTFSDLGATITGPAQDLNLGISVSVDGGATTTPEQISIDTSTSSTHMISYFATDQSGETGYATRSVVVEAPTSTP
jgi:hypothetical protein